MTTFEFIVKKIAFQLSSEQFKLLSTIRDSGNNEKVIIFYKAENPVIYFVSIVDFDSILSNEYESMITRTVDEIMLSNKSLFNSAICVNLAVGKDIGQVKQFSDLKDAIYDGNKHYVWWYTDYTTRRVYAGKGQPNKIYNIEEMLKKALESNDVNFGETVEDISSNVERNLRIEKVSEKPIFITLLIILNLILFGIEVFNGGVTRYVFEFGLNASLIFSDYQIYRLITYMFIHANLRHVLVNCVSLYIYGSKVEKYFGRGKSVVIYFLSGLIGGLLSAYFNAGFSIGASGAVFSMMGAFLAICKKTKKQIDGLGYMTMLLVALISIGMGFFDSNVDNFGHIGGFISGFAIGTILYKYKKE